MEDYERHKLAEAFKEEYYKDGDYIIKQGDEGNIFYIISEGEAIATKSDGGAPA